MRRRLVLGHFAVAALAGTAVAARAQAFPTRPIKIVVPYSAGGSPDTVARIVAQYLGAVLGQPVLVENLPGSSGIAAIEKVRNEPADGHTLLMADAAHWAVNRVTKLKLPHNFQKDLEPVSITSTSSLFLSVHESFPGNNLKELVAAVKARPGVYTYGSSGIGSLHHLSMEAFKAGLGLDILHVPYKGTGQSVPALAAGQVSMAIAAYNSVGPFAKAGKVKIIAANTREPSDLLPQYPSMGAAGIKDFDFPGENALFAPSGTPKAVIDKLLAGLSKVLVMPEAVSKLHAAGVEAPKSVTPAALIETMQRDIPRYAQAVKVAGIQPD
jgi:tripartite-type tricarboxylate transporter receptor subunit TctC